MTIHLRPDLAAILEKQVAAGHFDTVEEALEAAILGLEIDTASDEDLSWVKPLIEEAEREITAGKSSPAEHVWSRLEERLGRK